MIQRQRKHTPEAIFVFLSLLLHFIVCLTLYFKPYEPAPFSMPENVEVKYINPQGSIRPLGSSDRRTERPDQ